MGTSAFNVILLYSYTLICIVKQFTIRILCFSYYNMYMYYQTCYCWSINASLLKLLLNIYMCIIKHFTVVILLLHTKATTKYMYMYVYYCFILKPLQYVCVLSNISLGILLLHIKAITICMCISNISLLE